MNFLSVVQGEVANEVADRVLWCICDQDGVDAEGRKAGSERAIAQVESMLLTGFGDPVGVLGGAVERQVEGQVIDDREVDAAVEAGDEECSFGCLTGVVAEGFHQALGLTLDPPARRRKHEAHGISGSERCRGIESEELGQVGDGQCGIDALMLDEVLLEPVARSPWQAESFAVGHFGNPCRTKVGGKRRRLCR